MAYQNLKLTTMGGRNHCDAHDKGSSETHTHTDTPSHTHTHRHISLPCNNIYKISQNRQRKSMRFSDSSRKQLAKNILDIKQT